MTIKGNKASGKYKQAHTDNVKKGMGDYYGSGIPGKIGRMRDGFGFEAVSPKGLKVPPKNLA